MKSAALIYNRPVQLLIYSLHGKHTHTHTHTHSLLLVLHIISSSLLHPPLSLPQTLSPPLPGCSLLSGELDFPPPPLFCVRILPQPPPPFPPLTVLVHLTCSPALFAIVFYTLSQTFLSHNGAPKKLRRVCACVRASERASDLANLFSVFNLKAVGQR